MVLKTFKNGEQKECETCDVLWGILGVGLGLLFIAIGIDLATRGGISQRIGNVREEVESVEEYDEVGDDGDGDE